MFKRKTSQGLLCHVVCPRPQDKKERHDFRMAEHRGSFVCTGGTTVHWQWKSQHPIFVPPTHSSRTRDKRSVSIVLSRCSSLAGKWDTVVRASCNAFICKAWNQWGNCSRAVCGTKTWEPWAAGTPGYVMGTWWVRQDPTSVTAGALISVSTVWAVLTT